MLIRDESTITPEYRDRQIILLVKGHFSDHENVSLETLYAQWHGLHLHQVDEIRVMYMMLESFDRMCAIGVLKGTPSTLIEELFKRNHDLTGDMYAITPKAIIGHIRERYLSLRTKSATHVLIDIGKIDDELPNLIDEIVARDKQEAGAGHRR